MKKKERFLQVGDVIELKEGMSVYANFPTYKNAHIKLGEKLEFYKSLNKKPFSVFETKSYIGRYVVTDTNIDGGGTGHGEHDVYPDGWHVTCVKLNDDMTYCESNKKVTFYQSGCFTAMILPKNIKPIKGIKFKRTFIPTLESILNIEE